MIEGIVSFALVLGTAGYLLSPCFLETEPEGSEEGEDPLEE